MNILHLSTVDYGGAGTAMVRLHQRLRAIGINSRVLVRESRSDISYIYSLKYKKTLYFILYKVIIKVLTKLDYSFNSQKLSMNISAKDLLNRVDFTPDIIVVHSLSNFISSNDILNLYRATNAPIIFHLLDMASFTGGCHYAWDCKGYLQKCNSCPAIYFSNKFTNPKVIMEEKIKKFNNIPIAIVAGSAHLLSQVKKSRLFCNKYLEKILIGIDEKTFKPVDNNLSKHQLRIPKNKKIIFFGAQSFKDRRKGMSYLLRALKKLADMPSIDKKNILLVTAGHDSIKDKIDELGFGYQHIGFLQGDQKLALAYQAADMFICPSIEDSGPMMINEAMMCGTPVVAFEMGVATDLIISGKNGYIAKLCDSDSLAKSISNIIQLSNKELLIMSKNAREQALELCSYSVQTTGFLKLFKLLV